MKKIIILLFILFCPLFVSAEDDIKKDIVVSPSIIDEECKNRDMLEYSIKIKNISGGRVTLYAVVNDISEKEGIIKYKDPSDLDLSTSLTRWLEFRRGAIELDIDEEREVPLKINVHQDAPPGTYHARIAISKGSNRPQAIERAYKLNTEELLINLEVKEHIIEKVEITEFRPKSNISTKQPVEFLLKIKNIGNKEIIPQGEIVIYNNRGKEISSIKFNEKKEKIKSETIGDYSVNIDLPASFGKFKAKLRVEYGEKGSDLQDVVYFLLMPKFVLIFIVLVVLFLTVFLALSLSKKKKREIMRRENQGNFTREPIEETLEQEEEILEEDFNEEFVEDKKQSLKKNNYSSSLDLSKGRKKEKEKEIDERYVINLKSK